MFIFVFIFKLCGVVVFECSRSESVELFIMLGDVDNIDMVLLLLLWKFVMFV